MHMYHMVQMYVWSHISQPQIHYRIMIALLLMPMFVNKAASIEKRRAFHYLQEIGYRLIWLRSELKAGQINYTTTI